MRKKRIWDGNICRSQRFLWTHGNEQVALQKHTHELFSPPSALTKPACKDERAVCRHAKAGDCSDDGR